MQRIEGGITAPTGFRAAGIACGITPDKKDLALIVSDSPASAAAMFTTNAVAAAPVVFDREQLQRSSKISAIVVNSGVANACTGEQGMKDCRAVAAGAAELLSFPPEQVLVCSTGVIGSRLPTGKILNGLGSAAARLSPEHHLEAELAIMTTDTVPKEYAVQVGSGRGAYRIGAMAKGAGMIKPNMATMLAFLSTDAALDPAALDRALRQAVNCSFNRMSVDNDTSTNDTVLLLANGQARGAEIPEGTAAFTSFCDALSSVCIELVKMLVRDGEGSTKLIEIRLANAASEEDALVGARAIADSCLVKTAVHGEDPNWGRIVCALGYAGIALDPEQIQLRLNDVPILGPGFEALASRGEARKALACDTVEIAVDLGIGRHDCTLWTSDLSQEYITINAEYTT